MKFFLPLMFSAIVILLWGCRGNVSESKLDSVSGVYDTALNNNASINDNEILGDNNFRFINITSTAVADLFENRENRLYADSTYKVAFSVLSAKQKEVLIGPFIKKILGVEPNYVVDFMNVFFVSKQEKINGLQPIIVWIDGDDYTSLTLIILDEKYKYIDGYNLRGGMLLGPENIGDSIMVYDGHSGAVIKKNTITKYVNKISEFSDTSRNYLLIDSNIYEAHITPKGEIIETKQVNNQHKKFKD